MQLNCSSDVFTAGKWDHKSDLHLQLAVKSYIYISLCPALNLGIKCGLVCVASNRKRRWARALAKRSKSGFYPHTSPPKVKTLSLLYRLYARTLFFSFFVHFSLILLAQLPIFGRLNEQHRRISRAYVLGLDVNFADVLDNMSHFDNEILYDVRNCRCTYLCLACLHLVTYFRVWWYLFQSMDCMVIFHCAAQHHT